MNRRRTKQVLAGVGAATVLAVAGTTPGCPSDPRTAPVGCPETVVDISDQQLPYWPNSTEPRTWDATGQAFAVGPGRYLKYRPTSYRADEGCWVGGDFATDLDPQSTPWDTWHGIGTVIVDTPGVTIHDATIDNTGDAIGFDAGSQGWRVDGVRVGLAHDDCAQADYGTSGVIVDSLFENCASAFLSSRGAAMNGTGDTIEVADSLVQLIGFRESYRNDDYGEGKHGGFFKWDLRKGTPPNCVAPDGVAPALYVHDSTFRSDEKAAPFGGAPGGTMAFPRFQRDACGATIAENRCENVTLIGDGFTPTELATWEAACDGLTHLTGSEGVAEWDRLVAEWLGEHP